MGAMAVAAGKMDREEMAGKELGSGSVRQLEDRVLEPKDKGQSCPKVAAGPYLPIGSLVLI